MDLCFQVATWVGFGRMSAVLDIVDDLPEDYTQQQPGSAAPWNSGTYLTAPSF